MAKKLREVFVQGRTKVTSMKPTGSNSALLEYDVLDTEGEVTNSGVAACFDVESVDVDDDNCLTGGSRLSANGQFVVARKAFDRSGLGYK